MRHTNSWGMRNYANFLLWSLLSVLISVFTAFGQTGGPLPYTVKSLLPKEFCSPLDGDNGVVIGISNPGRDSVTGREEALMRAYIVASLRERVEVSMVSDFFTSAGESSLSPVSRYEEMYSIVSVISAGISLRPLYTFILSSGETVLFARVVKDAAKRDSSKALSKTLHRFECSLYHIENTLERGQHIYKSSYRFYPQKGVKSKIGRESFELYSFNNLWFTVSGEFNGNISARENAKYFYTPERGSLNEMAAPDGSIGVSMVEGLWPAYISALLWQIAGVLDYGNPSVSRVTDSHSKSIRNLNRSAESNIVRAELLRLIPYRERLYPVVKIDQLNPGEK